ncbi:MAG: short-chain dehydrogenase/reductase, partial [Betaproteobacteria bacterium]
MDLELTGRKVLLTGASKGIGLAAGQLFAQEGCEVILAARDSDRLNAAADAVRAHSRARVHTLSADLSDEQSRQSLIERFGDIDILVNNAGSNPPGEIDDIDDAQWRKAWDLKVFGYVNMTRAFYSAMKRRRSGVIINVIGSSGERMQSDYILGSSGNSALMGLTRALGSRSPDYNVRVVGINPGLTETDRAR